MVEFCAPRRLRLPFQHFSCCKKGDNLGRKPHVRFLEGALQMEQVMDDGQTVRFATVVVRVDTDSPPSQKLQGKPAVVRCTCVMGTKPKC